MAKTPVELGKELIDELYDDEPNIGTCIGLIQAGADLTIDEDGDGKTALYLSCRFKVPAVALEIIKQDRAVPILNKQDTDPLFGLTPLMVAVESDLPDVVDALIKRHADLNIVKPSGHTALYLACSWQHERPAMLLIEAGADVTKSENMALKPYDLSWIKEALPGTPMGRVKAALILRGAAGPVAAGGRRRVQTRRQKSRRGKKYSVRKGRSRR